ncbi:hypothetical protein AB0E12_25465 [Micromonospora chersina]|uniref:hypothetical protein n=1 Tax=Micromonospora chersina TaxID=47854 RepID=UPI0033E71597
MDPLLFGIATNLATDVLKAAYLRSRDIGLGDAETRALRRAFTRAFGVLATDVVQARQDELTPDLVTLVEGQLRRLVTDAAIAEMLLAAALEERGPDPARLRERFEELGFDPQTFLTDFDTAMSRFRYALADELLQEAGMARSPLFNRVVLAQLAAVRDELAHLAGRPGADESRTPAGRPIREWTDPFALEVHPAISAGADPADVLPQYVRREHDAELGRIVASAMDGRSVIRVLVGGSSTGKTRACWEALRLLPDTWRLWHPLSPGRSEALLGGFAAVGPRTVLWLNDLHDYLLHDPAAGERVAAGLRELLRDPDRGPVLILGTTWPEYWARLTVPPPPVPSDPHAQARSLLTGTDLVVPQSFAEPDRERAAEAARSDARLRDALEHAIDGEVAQYLAGGPALLERYRTAPPAAKAVIEAAMDARRLGHGPDLSRDMLRRAAPGYLTGRQREGLAEDWREEALAYTGTPCRGASGPVAGRPTDASPLVYRLADYLDQWARRARATVLAPASTWDALYQYGAEQDLPAVAKEANRRHLYRRAAALYRPAAEASDVDALRVSAHYLAVVGEVDEALMVYERAADAGYSLALEDAAQALADLGLVDASLTWWRMAADAGNNRAHYAGICAARSLARAGRLDEALEWWERAADPDDDELVWYNSTLRLRCWWNHRIPSGVLDNTVTVPFGNTGAQLALLDAARALHRAGRLAEALRWYERAADVKRSQVVTWYQRQDPESDEVHEVAHWLTQQLDRKSRRTVTDPADVFFKVAWKGHSLAVLHGAQALAEAGDTAETVRWLFDKIRDDGQAVTVAAKVFRIARHAKQAAEWIQRDDGDLAVRVRAHPWADAFREASREICRSGRPDWAGAINDTYGAEIFDVLEPRGAPYAELPHPRHHRLDLADLHRKVAGGDVDQLATIAQLYRAAGRTEEAVKAYLHSAECGKDGFSEAVDLLRQAGREDEAERLARFGLEPGGASLATTRWTTSNRRRCKPTKLRS